MIPGEVAGWRELVGNVYRSPRFKKPFLFGPFGIAAYEMAATHVIPWPKNLLVPGKDCEDQPRFGHPLTLALLMKAQKRLTALTGRQGVFTSNGFFRPPGLTWGIGKFADVDGAIDSTDPWGHWRGIPIDIGRTATALSFGVDRATLLNILASIGVVRPLDYGVPGFEGEPWHFRSDKKRRDAWAAKHGNN